MFSWVSPFCSGGYENFYSQYPELCTEVKTIDHSGTETEKRVISHSEKLSHHKPDYDQVWKHPLQYSTSHPFFLSLSQHYPFHYFNLHPPHPQKKRNHIRETYLAAADQTICSDLPCSLATSYLTQKEERPLTDALTLDTP